MLKKSAYLICLIGAIMFSDKSFAQEVFGDVILDSLLRELKIAKDDTNKTKLLYKVADRYGQHDPEKQYHYVMIGKAHADKHDFKRASAVFLSMLGSIKHDQGDSDSTLFYYNRAYEMHKKNGDERNMALMLVDISSFYNWKGDNIEAIRYLTRAQPILEKIKDYENLIVLYTNFAALYINEGNFEKALQYQIKALKNANSGKVMHKYANIYKTLGSIYAGLKDTVKAIKFGEQSINLAKKHHRNYDLAQSYLMMSDLITDNDQKLMYLLEARKIWQQISPEHPISTSVIGSIGELYLKQAIEGKSEINGKSLLSISERKKLLDFSARYIDTALTLSKKNGYTQNVMFYTGVKAELMAESGNYKQAYEDFTDHLALYDSLYSQQNKNKISEIESENEILLRDQKILEKESHIREMLLYGIIIVFIFVLIFLYFLNKGKITQLRLKNSLIKQESMQREAELQMKNKIMESELKLMRAQMNPHFIFNVLNNIESYILKNDPKTASKMIQKFAKLSRLILENSTQNTVPISRDWSALILYVELENLRFNTFSYSFHIDENINMDLLQIPPMLVQPIVENAIHHGLRPSPLGEKKLDIKLNLQEDSIVFTVTDNGVGFNYGRESNIKKVSYKEKSMGLESIRERLEMINIQLNKRVARLILKDRPYPDQGTVVEIILPII